MNDAAPRAGALGTQVVVDLEDCDVLRLDDPSWLEDFASDLALTVEARVLTSVRKRFEPQGETYLAILSASHLAIHTWPEHRAVTVDIFVCGRHVDPRLIESKCIEAFGATGANCSVRGRGITRETES